MQLRSCLFIIVVVFCTGCSRGPGLNKEHKVSIISITPSSGPAGTTVIIKGANFGLNPSDNIVRFNKDTAAVLASAVDSLIVIAPTKGSTGPVTVTVAGNLATGPVFTYTTDSVDVYFAAAAFGVVYWKNGQEVFLESTQNNTGGAYGIALSDTDVYVGGYTYFGVYPSLRAAYWKNGKKTMLSSPNYRGEIRSLVLSGSDLYAGGSENDLPAYWKNGIKYSLPIVGGGYARINALAIDGNDIYAAGFEAGPGNEQHSVYWKNGIETVLGKNGVVGGGAVSIAVKGNDAYVCGTDSGEAVYWKNGVKTILEKFPGDGPVITNATAIAGNSIYVVGSYRGDAVYWKDGTRITLPSRGTNAAASAITFYQSDMYIGGRDGTGPVYWKNGVEVSLCCSLDGMVTAIAVVKKPGF
jgi:hypothetical protein